jgi:hypothetical protein
MVDLYPFHQSETQVPPRASQGAKAQGGCCNGFHELEGTGLKSDHHLKFFDAVLTEDKHCPVTSPSKSMNVTNVSFPV